MKINYFLYHDSNKIDQIFLILDYPMVNLSSNQVLNGYLLIRSLDLLLIKLFYYISYYNILRSSQPQAMCLLLPQLNDTPLLLHFHPNLIFLKFINFSLLIVKILFCSQRIILHLIPIQNKKQKFLLLILQIVIFQISIFEEVFNNLIQPLNLLHLHIYPYQKNIRMPNFNFFKPNLNYFIQLKTKN